MKVTVEKRTLTEQELDILIEEVKKFFSPIVGYTDKWKKFEIVYVATNNNQLMGMCGVEKVQNWLMLHPFVVLEKYQGKGIGSLLMENIIKDNRRKNIFIGSQNPTVAKITKKYGFKTVRAIALPLIVKLYLFKFTLDSVNIRFIKALIEKRSLPRGKFKFFIKTKKPNAKMH